MHGGGGAAHMDTHKMRCEHEIEGISTLCTSLAALRVLIVCVRVCVCAILVIVSYLRIFAFAFNFLLVLFFGFVVQLSLFVYIYFLVRFFLSTQFWSFRC